MEDSYTFGHIGKPYYVWFPITRFLMVVKKKLASFGEPIDIGPTSTGKLSTPELVNTRMTLETALLFPGWHLILLNWRELLLIGDSKAQSLVDFRDIERAVKFCSKLGYFKRRIEENSMLTISINADSRWALIDLDDLVSALSFFAIDDNGLLRPNLEDKHRHRIYTLTGPELVSGPI
ncbi:11430_t:CDS:2, partial [Ambispora gerdemannii]